MSKLHKAQTSQGHSKHFFEFIRLIGEAKSKQEEDKVITTDLVDLKKTISEKNISPKTMKEYVVRMYYSEMLGHNADFAHIHSVNLASATDLTFKRTGYLSTWLCVNPEHEFMYLIVAVMQRDMKSSNFLEVSAALTAAAKLLRPELMASINNDIVNLLSHTNALVRRKVVLCMHAFYKKSDGLVGDVKNFRTALCDRDPSVMGTALLIFHEMALADPASQKDILQSFVSILKQIVEHRLSREFDYHRVPAPWFQIRLLKIIGIICADDEELSASVAETVLDVMKRADSGLNIGHAVIFEAINTITNMYPIDELIEAAAEAIAKFMTAANANMKYLGITALSRIVKIDPKYAAEHQHIVIGCLEDSDETIRRKTLSLLFAMCNENNVEAIVGRLLKFLQEATDRFLRQELVQNICDLAEKFSPSTDWYVETLNKVLELASEHVTQTTIQGMLKTIAEGEGEDEAEDAQFRTACVENYFKLVENPDRTLPAPLYQVVAWTIGEYGFLTKRISRAMMIDRLCDLLERVQDSETRGWILTAMMKLVAHNSYLPDNVEDLVAKLNDSRSVSLQQRSYEFATLLKMPQVLKKMQPLDGCCEDIEVDETLSFLDPLVESALAQGAKPRAEKKETKVEANGGLRMDAYKNAQTDVVNEEDLTADKFNEEEEVLHLRGEGKWGEKNLAGEAAVDQPIGTINDEGETVVEETEGGGGHVDPMGDVEVVSRKKPTKNEKFFGALLGGEGGAKKRGTKKRGAARAQEALRRAEEAAAATADMPAPHAPTMEEPSEQPSSGAGPSPPTSGGPAPNVELNIQKQLAAEAVLYRVGILTSEPIERVVVNLTPPKKTNLNVRCNLPGSEVRGTTVQIEALPAKQPHWIELQLLGTDYPQGGGLAVNVSYGSAAGPGSKTGGIALALPDLIRPTSSINSSDAFSQAWKSPDLTGEFKVQLKFPGNLSPDTLARLLQEKANIKLLAVINRECISAAQIVPSKNPILLHTAVDGQNANTTIRTTNRDFSAAVAQTLLAGLQAMSPPPQ